MMQPPPMKTLRQLFDEHDGRLVRKWVHYLDIYEKHFHRFRGRQPVVLEIGTYQGGSLQLWRKYFGEDATIIGVDINPRCAEFADAKTQIFIGDQADRNFLRKLRREIPPVDILIDDGGHRMEQQMVTFEELFGHVKDGGVYLSEDLHTSYWPGFDPQSGYGRRCNFIEFSKHLVDQLNAWHSRAPHRLSVNDFTRSTHSLTYYNSMLVIEKAAQTPPEEQMMGTMALPDFKFVRAPLKDRIRERLSGLRRIWDNRPFSHPDARP